MTNNYTYSSLKKRILDTLFEYSYDCEENAGNHSGLQLYTDRLSDIVSGCIVRMFESLPESKCRRSEKILSHTNGLCKVEVPSDLSILQGISCLGTKIPLGLVSESQGYYVFPCSFAKGTEEVMITYRKKAPRVNKDTADDFIFEFSPLFYEALICLCAAELCREDDSGLYTRLVYKYNDLTEGFFSSCDREINRNAFYKFRGRRW